MICGRCHSALSSFGGELALHFAGLEGLTKPIVWLFPQVHVCLKCGTAEFAVPDREKQVLITGKRVAGAVVSEDHTTEDSTPARTAA
jgi:hypothetical protein